MTKNKKTTTAPTSYKIVLVCGIGIVALLFLLSLGLFLSLALFAGIVIVVLNLLILSGAEVSESTVRLSLLLSILAIIYGLYIMHPIVTQLIGI